MRVVIMMPVYEDWQAAMELCRNIDSVLSQDRSIRSTVLFVDDGSRLSQCPSALPFEPKAISRVALLKLQRNLGHQRAIAVALAYVREHWQGDAVVIMDADGEDRPEDIPRLLAAMGKDQHDVAVFAERGRRLESLSFRFLYRCYSVLHRIIAGRDIRFGNFSVLPWSYLNSLVLCPEMWNHYAATFLKLRLPYTRVRCDRGHRLAGRSRMNFVSLVVHGISAVFANQEVVGTRLLLMTLTASFVFLLFIGIILVGTLVAHLAVPAWVAVLASLSFLLISQLLLGSFMLMFSVMMTRSHLGFLPMRDYSYFVADDVSLYSETPAAISAAAGRLN